MSSRRGHAPDPDAHLLEDDDDDLLDPRNNPHASATRWRHEESSSYRKHASGQHHHSLEPRSAEAKSGTLDLAEFLKSSRVEPDHSGRPISSVPDKHSPIMLDENVANAAGEPHLDDDLAQAAPQDGKTVACGPLLNYKRMEGNAWIGSVLIVTKGGGKTQAFVPTLALRKVGEAQHIHTNGNGVNHGTNGNVNGAAGAIQVRGQCLYSDYRNTFWRFDLHCEMERSEIKWEYTVPDMRYVSKHKPQKNSFYVPAVQESMRSTAPASLCSLRRGSGDGLCC